jgi:hypothetical protein
MEIDRSNDGKEFTETFRSATPTGDTMLGMVETRPFTYHWHSHDQFRFIRDDAPSLLELIERLQQVPHPLVFAVTLHPTAETHDRIELYPVQFRLRLSVSEQTDSETFGEIEQSLRSIFPEAPLVPNRADLETDPPKHLASRHATRLLTTVPSPTELHKRSVCGLRVPLEDSELSTPEIYYDPTWSLGTPFDEHRRVGTEPVGYSSSRLPATLLRIAGSNPGVDWSDQPPTDGFLNDVRQFTTLDQPLFIVDTRDNLREYYLAINDKTGFGEPQPLSHWMAEAFRSQLDYGGPAEAPRALCNYLVNCVRQSNWVMIIDLSDSSSPARDATTFFVGLLHAIGYLQEPDTEGDPACSLAIDDAGVLLQDDLMKRMDADWPIPQEAAVSLQCRYPIGTSKGTTQPSLGQTTATQATILRTLMTTVADGTVIENTASTRKLFRQLDISRDFVDELAQLSRDLWDGTHLWGDRMGPTPNVRTGLLAHEEAHEESHDPENYNVFEYDSVPRTQSIDWDTYRPASTTESQTTGTERESTTTAGPPGTRIARPQQTTEASLPQGAVFDPDSDTYQCTACERRYDPVQSGLWRVCQCCGKSASHIDRDAVRAIPPVEPKRSATEIADSPCSEAQLVFLRACYLAKQFAFDPVFQFDPLTDSMQRLREDLSIAPDAVAELTDLTVDGQGVLTKQATTTPHTVYNVTATGRSLIAETLDDGVDFGPGVGDLNESMLHRIGVQYLCRYLESTHGQSPDRTVQHYHQLPTGEVIDAVVLEDDTIVVAAEMECHNNDVSGAESSCRSTYRKLMDCESTESIWVFETGDHWSVVTEELAAAHRDPQSPIEFRDSGYSRSYISKDPSLKYPGLTEALTLAGLLKTVDYPSALYQRDHTRFRPD